MAAKNQSFNIFECKSLHLQIYCLLKDDVCAFQKGVGCSEWRRGPHTRTQTHRQNCQLYSGQCRVYVFK